MERLSLDKEPAYAGLEASIHIARYALASSLVKGMRVLDISCGEGYGTYLLKQFGASRVIGVDVSLEAIERAQKKFGGNEIYFQALDASELENTFETCSFDVIVSIETIEHLPDPEAFLRSLKTVATRDAVIIITCPNDYWYFPTPEERNPYHLKKYHFEDFRRLANGVLGENGCWSIGTASFGFTTTPLEVSQNYTEIPDSWLRYRSVDGAFLVNGGNISPIEPKVSSYFVGVWGLSEPLVATAFLPLSMDNYASMVRAVDWDRTQYERASANLARLNAYIEEMKFKYAALEEEREQLQTRAERAERDLGLRLRAVTMENELIRNNLASIRHDRDQLVQKQEFLRATGHDDGCPYFIGHTRYMRLRKLLPPPLRRLFIRVFRAIKGRRV